MLTECFSMSCGEEREEVEGGEEGRREVEVEGVDQKREREREEVKE